MTDIKKGLTWSGKWHIIDASKQNSRYDISLCGAYLYNAEKEAAAFRGNRMPEHLTRIIEGTKKSSGDCKLCAKSAGSVTPEQVLASVEALATKWENATNLTDGQPNIVARAFADDLRRALAVKA